MELRGAGEDDRGGQHTRFPPFVGLAWRSPLLFLRGGPGGLQQHVALTRLFPCSASLDLFPSQTPLCLLAPVEGEKTLRPAAQPRHPGCHPECIPTSITASVANYTLISIISDLRPQPESLVLGGLLTLLPSPSPVFLPGVSAETPGDPLKPRRKRIGSYLGNKVPACHPGEGEAVQRESSFPFLRGTSSHRGGLCSGVPTRGLS